MSDSSPTTPASTALALAVPTPKAPPATLAAVGAAMPVACALNSAAKERRFGTKMFPCDSLKVSPDGRWVTSVSCFPRASPVLDGEIKVDIFRFGDDGHLAPAGGVRLPSGGGEWESATNGAMFLRCRGSAFLDDHTLGLLVDGRLLRIDVAKAKVVSDTRFGDSTEHVAVSGNRLAVAVYPTHVKGQPRLNQEADGVHVLGIDRSGDRFAAPSRLLGRARFGGLPREIAFSASGRELIAVSGTIFAGGERDIVAVASLVDDSTRVLNKQEAERCTARISNVLPDGRFVLVTLEDIRAYDGTFAERLVLPRQQPARGYLSVALTGDGRWLYEASSMALRRWRLEPGSQGEEIAPEIGPVGEVEAIPGHADRVICRVNERPHYRLVVIDTESGRPIASFPSGAIETVEPQGIDVDRRKALCVARGVELLALGGDLSVERRIDTRVGRIFQLWSRPSDGDLFVVPFDERAAWWDGARLRPHLDPDGAPLRRWDGLTVAVPLSQNDYYCSRSERSVIRLSSGPEALWVFYGAGRLNLWKRAGHGWRGVTFDLLAEDIQITDELTMGAVLDERWMLLVDGGGRMWMMDPRPFERSPPASGSIFQLAAPHAQVVASDLGTVRGMFALAAATILAWTEDRLWRLRFADGGSGGGGWPRIATREALDEPGVRGVKRLGDGRLVVSFDHHHSFRTADLVERWRLYLVAGNPLYFVPARPGGAAGDRLDGLLWYEGGPAALPSGVLRVSDARGEPVIGARAIAYLETIFDQRLVAKVVAGNHAGVAAVVGRAAARQTLVASVPRALAEVGGSTGGGS